MLCEEEALYSAYLEQRATAKAAKTRKAPSKPAAFTADDAPGPAVPSDTAATDQTSESS
jgi:hypothetical protein